MGLQISNVAGIGTAAIIMLIAILASLAIGFAAASGIMVFLDLAQDVRNIKNILNALFHPPRHLPWGMVHIVHLTGI